MQFDRATVAVRERGAYEAIDLGFALVRDSAGAIWKPWLIVTVPIFLLLNGAGALSGHIGLAVLLMWWLKPLFDCIPLFVLSRRFFGDPPATNATLKAVPGLWKASLPGALLWGRFDIARSFNLPVVQLEGLRGRRRMRRQRVLQGKVRSQAVMVTVVCSHLILFLSLALWLLLLMFVPMQYLPESAKAVWALIMQHDTQAAQFAVNLFHYLAMSVIEPFYVGAGFALYLNRRTVLEAWGVELTFRRMAKRLQSMKGGVAAGLAVVLLGCGFGGPVHAAESSPGKVYTIRQLPEHLPGDAGERIAGAVGKAYRNEALTPRKMVGHWRPVSARHGGEDKTPVWLRNLVQNLAALAKVIQSLGPILSKVVWLLLAVLAGLILWVMGRALYRNRHVFAGWGKRRSEGGDGDSAVLLEGGSCEIPLPADIPEAARKQWRAGHRRDALGLLYRGAVDRLGRRLDQALPTGATESECIRRAGKVEEPARSTFVDMARAWQYAAYAHRLPGSDEFEKLVTAWSDNLGMDHG